MPVLVAGSTVSGVRPKYRSAISCIVPVRGGTTDDRMMPVIEALSRPLWPNSCDTRMPSSSAVRSRSVCSRQLWVSLAPSNTPSTILVLPTSIARSIGVPSYFQTTSPAMTRSTRFPTLTSRAPSSAIPAAIPLARPSGVSHSTAAPIVDGARRRHRARRPDASPRAIGSSSAASPASTSASTTPGSIPRPSSVSIEDARSAISGGYDAGLRLIPMPRMTCCRPSADEDASASTPASLRRRETRWPRT